MMNTKTIFQFILTCLAFLAVPTFAFAYEPAHDRTSFCQMIKDPGYAQKILSSPTNNLVFANGGGLFGQGVCWWHSLFTRSAAYKTIYYPHAPKPDSEQVARIIYAIAYGKQIVAVPGYRNLLQFSWQHATEIQDYLNQMQWTATLNFDWINGLQGSSEVSAIKLKNIMDQTFFQIKYQKKVVFQMLQRAGPAAHAWLVVDMDKTSTGYNMKVIDSNAPLKSFIYEYKYGMTNFKYNDAFVDRFEFVPFNQDYADRQLEEFKLTAQNFCQNRN